MSAVRADGVPLLTDTETGHSDCHVAGVLAGGHSRRMGQPKALLRLPNGRILIEHAVEVASQTTGDVVILGQAISLPPSLARLAVLADEKPDGGPLAGLCSLLRYAKDRWALLLACDLPYVGVGLIERVLGAQRPDVDAIAFVKDASRPVYHACCAAYHPRVLADAVDELVNGKGSLQGLLGRVNVAALQPTADEVRQLENVNTPEDIARLQLGE